MTSPTSDRPVCFADTLRRLHLDFHNPAGIPDLCCGFDAEEFAATVAGAGYDSATVFAQDAHGHAYFPTQIGVPHPHLQVDLLGEQTAALHRHGVSVAAYVNTGCSDYSPREWAQYNAKGEPRVLEPDGYNMVCLNSPYIEEEVLPLTREILGRYPVDAMWYDLLFFFDEGCHCRWCRERMAREGLDPAMPADVRRHMRGSTGEFARKVRTLLDEVRPGLEFTLNGLSLYERPEGLELAAYVDVECLASGGWGYFYFPAKGRYLRTLGKPVTGMTAAFHVSWGDFGTLKSRALLEHECWTFAASGATVAIGDQMPPQGRLEPARYARMGEVLQPLAKLEPLLRGAKPVVEAAIVLGPLAQGQFPLEPWAGACKLLMEQKVQFDTVDREGDWSPYRLLVLPDRAYADEAMRAKVAEFLEEGGMVLATGQAGEALPEGLLKLGAKPDQPAYLQVVRGEWDWAPGVPDLPMAVRAGVGTVEAPGAEVLATLTRPYPPRGERFFFSSPQAAYDEETTEAVMVQTGEVIYLAAPLFGEYMGLAYGGHRELLRGAVRRLLSWPLCGSGLPLCGSGLPLCGSGLPLAYEQALLAQGDKLLSVVVPYAAARGEGVAQIEEWPRLAEVTVGVRGEYRRAWLAPEGTELECACEGGYTRAKVKGMEGPVLVVFE